MPTRPMSLVLLGALLVQSVACMHKKPSALPPGAAPATEQERIVAVTTTAGQEIRFLKPYARLEDGHVVGIGNAAYEIAEGQVQRAELTKEGVRNLRTKDGVEIIFEPPGGQRHDGIISGIAYQPLRVPAQTVQRYWIEKSSVSIGRTVGLIAAIGVATLGIIAATKESCPFVYSWDGSRFVFDAEPYGGAITRGMERDDYGELEHLREDGGVYRLLVTNEVRETQYTNLLELWVVDHPRGVRVVADEFGGLHTLQNPEPALSARDGRGEDVLGWLEKTDRLIWEPPAVPDGGGELGREIVMTFRKPAGARQGKLVTNVATGLWGSKMIREMLALRGRELDAWYASIDSDPAAAEELLEWNLREGLYGLALDVQRPAGWEPEGILVGGGPLVAEDRVIPLDVAGIPGDEVHLRLRLPAGFWALNSFAMDWSADQPVDRHILKPVEATDSRGVDRRAELALVDDRYYAMPETGDRAHVSFRAPASVAGMERTLLLHSRGYYRLHLPSVGEPDRDTLQEITDVQGAAARFAAARYAEWRSGRMAVD